MAKASEFTRSASINLEGDGKLYTPKARIDGAGSKSSKVLMYMPEPGPQSTGDYINAMWFRDANGFVFDAASFKASGKSNKDPVDGVQGKPIEPKFFTRIDAGTGTVVPMVHSYKGYVWEGKPLFVK